MAESMIESFNNNVKDLMLYLCSIMKDKVTNLESYYILWDDTGKFTMKKVKLEQLTVDQKRFEYLWIEFEYKNDKYKISAFYKDYDRSNGNIHVLPGAIQIWKKVEQEKDFDFPVGSGIEAYPEPGWMPILKKPYFWHGTEEVNVNEIAKQIWKLWENCKNSENFVVQSPFFSSEFYARIPRHPDDLEFINRLENILQNEKYYPKTGHYRNYYALKWYDSMDECKKISKRVCLYKLVFDDTKQICFADFSKLQEFGTIYEHGKSCASHWTASWNYNGIERD